MSVSMRKALNDTNSVSSAFTKLPVGAFEIRTDREQQIILYKTVLWVIFDALLACALITVLVMAQTSAKCYDKCTKDLSPVLYYLILCVFASFTVNCITQHQVKRSFIKRGVALSSLALDFLIFVGAIWESVVLLNLTQDHNVNQYNAIFIAEACLCGVTFLRVINVVLMILYILCVLPWYCAPDCCPCTRYLKGEDLDPAVFDLLNKNAWTFDKSALED